MNHQRLKPAQFQQAVNAAKQHFSLIRKKYADLQAYLVIGMQGNQTKIDSSLGQMIDEFPDVLVNGSNKMKILNFIKTPLPDKPTETQKLEWAKQFQKLADRLEYNGQSQVEIRFHHLDYELIWKLQSDNLVDRQLTPQTKASIRIILGRLSDFVKTLQDTDSASAPIGQPFH
jgi:hypothetical protein